MCADLGDEFEYDYYFMLYDRLNDQVLWKLGLDTGEFDEPGPIAVTDDGAFVYSLGNRIYYRLLE